MTSALEVHAECVSENSLAAFSEGHVAAEARGRIEEHLLHCSECRHVFAETARAQHADVQHTAVDRSSGPHRSDVVLEPIGPGTLVGRYVVGDPIGRGAMGTVYAANDPDLDRKVAVKVLRADSLSESARRRMGARLLREAKAMARLSHPEVMTVYEVGVFADQIFVAMEYVDGETLRAWRAARHRGFAEILEVYERAGIGLAAAHDAGLVHRDFKPDNVLVGRDGRVRVTDFGLARSVADGAVAAAPESGADEVVEGWSAATTLTHTGTLLGTPAYMAPEQLRGGGADARSDVFGFCVSLYEALYGERPFAGSTLRELRAAIDAGAVRSAPIMTAVPRWARTVILRGLRATPDERFSSMRGLLDALRAGHATARRRKGGAAWAAVVAFGVLFAAGTYGRGTWRSMPRAASRGSEPVGALPSATDPVAVVPAAPPRLALDVAPVARVPSEAPRRADVAAASDVARPSASASLRHARPAASARAPVVGRNGALILED